MVVALPIGHVAPAALPPGDAHGEGAAHQNSQAPVQAPAPAAPAFEPPADDDDWPQTVEDFANRGTATQFATLEWQFQAEAVQHLLRTRQHKVSDLTEEQIPNATPEVLCAWFKRLQQRPVKEA